jgi:cytochrome c oxidase subunit 2
MNELMRHALNLPPQASTFARHIDYLHYVVIGSAFVVCMLTFLAILYMLIHFREGKACKKHRRIPRWLEISAAAFTLTVFLVWWVIGFLQFRDMRTPPAKSMRVYVVAKQWMWEYVYPDGITAENELHVPVGQPVELLMTSRDVIHSFYVAAFRNKQDVVPGRITTFWFTATQPGRYPILCAEYCGAGHSRMRGVVVAMEPSAYAEWAAGHHSKDLVQAGEKLAADYGCLRCHTVDGTPHLGPSWKDLYGSTIPLAGGGTVVADDAYLTESMMDPAAKLHAGYPPLMPTFLGRLSGPEAAAIVEYIRSLRSVPNE